MKTCVMAAAMVVMASGVVGADTTASIDLTGVQLRNATNQARSSTPDAIDPGCTYAYSISGLVRGRGGPFTVLQVLFPNPTPLAQVLETLVPGSSAFLNGATTSPNGGTHPVALTGQTFEGTQVILGVTVTVRATISVGIDASDFLSFSVTNVTVSPSNLVGYLEFTSGSVVVTSTATCGADFNRDCFVDFFDYDDYVRCFEGEACPAGRDADFNGDGFVDFFDYDAFVSIFETGC
jgi:hypothetical protein